MITLQSQVCDDIKPEPEVLLPLDKPAKRPFITKSNDLVIFLLLCFFISALSTLTNGFLCWTRKSVFAISLIGFGIIFVLQFFFYLAVLVFPAFTSDRQFRPLLYVGGIFPLAYIFPVYFFLSCYISNTFYLYGISFLIVLAPVVFFIGHIDFMSSEFFSIIDNKIPEIKTEKSEPAYRLICYITLFFILAGLYCLLIGLICCSTRVSANGVTTVLSDNFRSSIGIGLSVFGIIFIWQYFFYRTILFLPLFTLNYRFHPYLYVGCLLPLAYFFPAQLIFSYFISNILVSYGAALLVISFPAIFLICHIHFIASSSPSVYKPHVPTRVNFSYE